MTTNMADVEYAVLHVRVPLSHKQRLEAVVKARGDDYGAHSTFMRRALETQLLIEEHINGIDEKPALRALLTLFAALNSGLDVSDERCKRVTIESGAEAIAQAEKHDSEEG